jgi:hypothetical protein
MLGNEQFFEAQLSEYVSARDEVLGAIGNQHLVLTFGTASIVGLFAAGFVEWSTRAAAPIFFAIGLLALWVGFIWLGEAVRMVRAAAFCVEQAEMINQGFGGRAALRWEEWRRERGTIVWMYSLVVVALAGTDIASMVAGWTSGDRSLHGWPLWALILTTVLLAAASVVAATAFVKVALPWVEEDRRVRPRRAKI